jgi:hypothetical protein
MQRPDSDLLLSTQKHSSDDNPLTDLHTLKFSINTHVVQSIPPNGSLYIPISHPIQPSLVEFGSCPGGHIIQRLLLLELLYSLVTRKVHKTSHDV